MGQVYTRISLSHILRRPRVQFPLKSFLFVLYIVISGATVDILSMSFVVEYFIPPYAEYTHVGLAELGMNEGFSVSDHSTWAIYRNQ